MTKVMTISSSVQLGVIRVGSASVKSDDDWFQEISRSLITFELDSGAQGNGSSTYRTIQPVIPLQPTKVLLFGFVSDVKVKPMGKITLQVYHLTCFRWVYWGNIFRYRGSQAAVVGQARNRSQAVNQTGTYCLVMCYIVNQAWNAWVISGKFQGPWWVRSTLPRVCPGWVEIGSPAQGARKSLPNYMILIFYPVPKFD